jgi:ubiquinone/menaquinone biosynthesis C-methylase UbiE
MEQIIGEYSTAPVQRALILGVTPEIARLSWAATTSLLAVDKSQHMITAIWPGFPTPGKDAVCANWLNMPVPDNSHNIILGDASLVPVSFPNNYQRLLKEILRITTTGSLFAFRTFIKQKENVESPEEVLRDMWKGAIGSFHAFRLRLLMSLQKDAVSGVRLMDVWTFWDKQKIAPERLAKKTGWPLRHIQTIQSYKEKGDFYHFLTLEQLRAIFKEEGFNEVACIWPSYELGDRCPTLGFRVKK